MTGSGFTAVVRMVASENLYHHFSESWEPIFFAYGSRVDRRTGDPTYLEAVPLRVRPDRGNWFDFEADTPWYRCPAEPHPEEATVAALASMTMASASWRVCTRSGLTTPRIRTARPGPGKGCRHTKS